jgi:hypothetical protein
MTNGIRLAAILILLRVHPAAAAATLTEETKAAWDAYLKEANAAMQARLQPSAHFLWLDDEPGRAEGIRTKGPYIAPIDPHIPKKVPSGLIHDWLGVGFVPNVKIEDIIRVVRDYDRYKEIYQPGVIDSMSRGTNGPTDLFSMRLVFHASRKQIGGSEDGARCGLRSVLYSRGRSALVRLFQHDSHPRS